MIFRAIKFVAEAHEGQYRKGTRIPYIVHLMNVMKILCGHECETEVIVAGILHDTVEDTPVALNVIERKFGKRVAGIVAGASEPEALKKSDRPSSETWQERKQHTLDFLKNEADKDILLVACADKTDNVLSILSDFADTGNEVWSRFNAGRDQQKWYYGALLAIFKEKGKIYGNPLQKMAEQFESAVNQLFPELRV